MKRVLLIVAPEEFRDEELFKTKEAIEDAGITTVVASKERGTCHGRFGRTVEAQIALKEVNIDSYSAVAFIGGGGAATYYKDEEALNLVRLAERKGKILAAICIAPVILANAGLLQEKNVTSWPASKFDLEKKGANYTGNPVEVDGRVITANGPDSAGAFGKAIAHAVERM